ncbi:MAG: hypothetical protein JRI49_07165, partial [Deltaproteobacteria bacterium]|nr:hypothetical protein [Deltaproteobacteria bacterium]
AMVGGILILVNAVLIGIGMGDILIMFDPTLNITLLNLIGVSLTSFELFITNLIVAIGVIVCAFLSVIKPNQSVLSGVVIVSLGIMSLLSGNGFMIGAFISIIGGALILTE